MSDALTAATVAVSGALIIGFIANFVAEDYRRYRDGKSLARALAGELSSRGDAVEMLNKALSQILEALKSGEKVRLLKIEQVKDHVFEKGIEKLGLLENDLVEDVVYVYENIGAFRSAMILAAGIEDGDPQRILLIQSSLAALGRANARGSDLPSRLRAFSRRPYRMFSERKQQQFVASNRDA